MTIEAVTRSPVYGLVGECLLGVTSIRAYSDAPRFTAQLFDLVDGEIFARHHMIAVAERPK